jgi:hypothetical protein
LPQNSCVVPQKPYWLQQTFNGQVVEFAYFSPQAPGSHSDFLWQDETHVSSPQSGLSISELFANLAIVQDLGNWRRVQEGWPRKAQR